MAQILAFAGSNSSTSINFQLVDYTAGLISDHEVRLLNMAHFPITMYSADTEKEEGFPEMLLEMYGNIREADGIVLSVNEHNGGPSAYFKNLIDWLSRRELKFLEDRKIFLMSASPGKRGAIGSRTAIEKLIPRFGGEVSALFSLPSYKDNFKPGEGILDQDLIHAHKEELSKFLHALTTS